MTFSYPAPGRKKGSEPPPVSGNTLHGFAAKKPDAPSLAKGDEDSWDTPPKESAAEPAKRPTNPATPISLVRSRSSPSTPRPSQLNGPSIQCGPRNRISEGLRERGVTIEHADKFFSLVQAICPEHEERPLEADERDIWLGTTVIGKVYMHEDTVPTMQVPLRALIHANASKEGGPSPQMSPLDNTRTIDQLMRYFGTAWGKVVAAIQFGRDVMIVAKQEGIFLTSSEATFEMVG